MIEKATKDMIIQNLKLFTTMKSCGYTDREIAEALGINLSMMMKIISEDEFIKEHYEMAIDKVSSDIESKFINNMNKALEREDNTDAKWYLERVKKKYRKNDALEVSVKGIDEIINERNTK